MLDYAEPVTKLIDEFKRLPSIGQKSAQRLAFHILRLPDVAEKFAAQGVTPTGSSSTEFRTLIAGEIRQWADTVRAANIKVE